MKQSLLTRIYEAMPMQQKKIKRVFAKYPQMEEELALFLENYRFVLIKQQITEQELATAYIEMIENMMEARVEFIRTGAYPLALQSQAVAAVYDNVAVMTRHLLGLALSQFLWSHHYQIFSFYREHIQQLAKQERLLEVGSGHGLYTLEAAKNVKNWQQIDIVDISDTSLRITSDILQVLLPEAIDKVRFIHGDITTFQSEFQYDFITMGEVLEHVDNPLAILESLRKLLNPGGQLFITTCANSPSIDHVYHFHNMEEIRQLIIKAGYRIVRELVAPSEEKSAEWLEKYQADISYAAILEVETI